MDNLKVILVDDPEVYTDNLPLTYTRPVAELRTGMFTLADRWAKRLRRPVYQAPCRDYLIEKFGTTEDLQDVETVRIASEIIATEEIADAVAAMPPNSAIFDKNHRLVAQRGAGNQEITFEGEVRRINRPYDIFLSADYCIKADFEEITRGRKSQPLSPTNTVVGDPSLVFLEPGAKAECAVFNVTNGPIYLGANAEVMEGSLLRGPIAIGDHSVVNMGAKIYGATVLGPWCKVGGELNNVVMQGYSNKAHDGFLGNAVIGEWCNLGAGCVASNLKNNYTQIKLWSYTVRRFVPTGLQFCGLIMGDHSKAGINTMFNTATVIGVGVNVHQSGFPRAFVPSFSDGGSSSGFIDVPLAPFLDIARRVMARRGIELTEVDERMFAAIKEAADQYK